jgi:hypothetical protein
MIKTSSIDLNAVKQAGDRVSLFCKLSADAEWPVCGKTFDNWRQMTGRCPTLSEAMRVGSQFYETRTIN